jgi:hypothetical protein
MEPIDVPVRCRVYDLRLGHATSDAYYADVARFADKLLDEIHLRVPALIDGYSRHMQTTLLEPARSYGEYAIDLLTLGIVQRRYAGAAEDTPDWAIMLALEFSWLGRRSWFLRPIADIPRAAIHRFVIAKRIGKRSKGNSHGKEAGSADESARRLERLPHLIEWLQVAGDLNQEAMCLNNLRSFLKTFPEAEACRYLDCIVKLSEWFQRESAKALGGYTLGVPRFLSGEYSKRGWREDSVFCGKEQVEYHLAMVAAEIMNRGLRKEYETKPYKVVLVPACLRGPYALECQAEIDGTEVRCTECNPACTVNKVTSRMQSLGARVYLIPNCQSFELLLEHWRYRTDVGVTVVVCALNILPLGDGMRARGIASQLMPLDYPGCRAHWNPERKTSGINEAHLVQISLSNGINGCEWSRGDGSHQE